MYAFVLWYLCVHFYLCFLCFSLFCQQFYQDFLESITHMKKQKTQHNVEFYLSSEPGKFFEESKSSTIFMDLLSNSTQPTSYFRGMQKISNQPFSIFSYKILIPQCFYIFSHFSLFSFPNLKPSLIRTRYWEFSNYSMEV